MQKSQTFFQPEMEVVISVQESLLEGTQIDQGNLMTLTIESLYSPPESWTMTGSQYAYAAALPIPMSADVSERVDDWKIICSTINTRTNVLNDVVLLIDRSLYTIESISVMK